MKIHYRPTPAEEECLANVYVWEWPVRVCHWLIAGSIWVLSITGIYIGNPMLISPFDLAEVGYLTAGDLEGAPDFDSGSVQFGRVGAWKTGLLRLAWHRF